MASSSEVLREYLISLGFKVDNAQQKKFDTSIIRSGINVGTLAKTLLGAATAAQAFVAVWARSMEKLYYSSIRAESSAGKLQALQYAARTIGLTSESMQGALEGMARAMRLNPGLQGLIEQFGIKVTGRQKADVMIDLIDRLKTMPFYVAAQYASLFGINPDDLLLLEKGADEMKKAALARKEMADAAGLDVEAAAAAGKEYANQLREVEELFVILKDTAAIAMLPVFKEMAGVVKEVLKDWTQIIKSGDIYQRMKEGLGLAQTGGGVALSADAKRRAQNWTQGRSAGGTVGSEGEGDRNAAFKDQSPIGAKGYDRIRSLERQYGIPEGMLWRMFGAESNYGDPKYMTSSAGAKGPFQFMPKTAKEFGIAGNEMDFTASSGAAAEKLRGLLKLYGGDQRLAAAAYNWGQGNLASVGNNIDRAPSETRAYADKVGGTAPTINLETTIHVASSNPEIAGKSVAREQVRVGADILRNIAGPGVPQ